MKRWKKTMLILLCTGAVLSVTACGSDQNARDNVADDHMTTEEDRVNDATDHTGDNDGVMDEIGEDVREGADEVGDDIREGAEDLTDHNEMKNDR